MGFPPPPSSFVPSPMMTYCYQREQQESYAYQQPYPNDAYNWEMPEFDDSLDEKIDQIWADLDDEMFPDDLWSDLDDDEFLDDEYG